MNTNNFNMGSIPDIQPEASIFDEEENLAEFGIAQSTPETLPEETDNDDDEIGMKFETAKSASDTKPEAAVHEKEDKNAAYGFVNKRSVRRRVIRRIAVILCVILVICVGGIIYINYEANALEVSFYHLQSDNVDAPFRIVQLSDLHLHEFGERNKELVEWVRRLNPDIITITGDMNNHDNDDTHVVTDLCSQLTQITTVYYVMGNHEWADHINRHTSIKKDIAATGVIILENSFEEIELNENKIVIGGLVNEVSNYSKYKGPEFMKNFMEADGFKLLLVHYPEYFLGTLNDYSIDLAMCGHTHGGIIRIPFVGGLYASDQGFFPELYEGMQKVDGGSNVVVSRGLGGETSFPRINNRPEIVVVDVSWY
ncbi:MAG: metallophosphoesterase [Lachnospiraceae bacterium]|nr:metallophosphoesterase [Lachnospiraceae bacterium]